MNSASLSWLDHTVADRDKASLDVFWLRDASMTDLENLPEPDVLAQEIVSEMEYALERFREVLNDLDAEPERTD